MAGLSCANLQFLCLAVSRSLRLIFLPMRSFLPSISRAISKSTSLDSQARVWVLKGRVVRRLRVLAKVIFQAGLVNLTGSVLSILTARLPPLASSLLSLKMAICSLRHFSNLASSPSGQKQSVTGRFTIIINIIIFLLAADQSRSSPAQAVLVVIRMRQLQLAIVSLIVIIMLLFQRKEEPQSEPVDQWQLEFKHSLIQKCRAFIAKHPLRPKSIHKPKLWYNFESKKFVEQRSFSFESKGQGIYSEFIPVRANQSHSNELTEYFPYLKQNSEKAEYEVAVFSISESIQSGSDYDKWMQLCKEYLSDLTIEEMFDYYLLLVAKGTSFLGRIRAERDPQCRLLPFFSKILEVRRFFGSQEVRINPHISISLDQGEPINLQNLSKTMKQLFCPICLVYDCQTHLLSASSVQQHFQYVRPFEATQRSEERKRTALRLFKQLFVIFEQQPAEGEFCSPDCYKRLDEERWERLKGKRESRFFSPIFEGMIKMGIELFSYDPCRIHLLFSSSEDPRAKKLGCQANCEIVFSYLLQEHHLLQKMNFKFYHSEAEQLAKEALTLTAAAELTPKKPMRSKHCKAKYKDSEDSFNSVCHHYFLEREPSDVNCLDCECQSRGYCLPTCACSEHCELRIKGCRCRGESTCWENKCPCFKKGLMCLPGVCEHCERCDEAEGRANWCQNNGRALHRCKKTRIGKSGIASAGLGLFAQEFIRRGEFVIKYLGEVLSSISLQKLRENLVENNLFYTFKLNKYESVDSRVFGNKARFINHSKKQENIVPRAVNINEQFVIVFHALKDIQRGDELLFNYNGEGELSDFKEKFPFIE